MFKGLGKKWRALKADAPGERFVNHYRRSDHGGRLLRTVLITLGMALVVFGVATTFIPPFPGITMIVVGGLICAQQSELAARALDWCEDKLVRGWRQLKRTRG